MNDSRTCSHRWAVRPGEEGQGLVEYALILVLVAVVVIVMLAGFGSSVGGILEQVQCTIEGGAAYKGLIATADDLSGPDSTPGTGADVGDSGGRSLRTNTAMVNPQSLPDPVCWLDRNGNNTLDANEIINRFDQDSNSATGGITY